MGVWGQKGCKFIKEVGKLISDKTKEKKTYLIFKAVYLNGNTERKLCQHFGHSGKSKISRII